MKKLIKVLSAFILSTVVLLSTGLTSFAAVSFDNTSNNPIKFTVYTICRLGGEEEWETFKVHDVYYSESSDLVLQGARNVDYKNATYNGKEVTTIYGKSERAYTIYMFSFAGPTGYYFIDNYEYYKPLGAREVVPCYYSSTGFEPYTLRQLVTDYSTNPPSIVEDDYIYQKTYLSDKSQKIRLYTYSNNTSEEDIDDFYDTYVEWAKENEGQINPAEFNTDPEPITSEPIVEPEPIIEEPQKEPEMIVVTPTLTETETIVEPEPVVKEESNTSWMIWVFGVIFIGICAFAIIKFKKE